MSKGVVGDDICVRDLERVGGWTAERGEARYREVETGVR